MSVFFVTDDAVRISTAPPPTTDIWCNGLRNDNATGTLTRAFFAQGDQWANGLPVGNPGQLACFDVAGGPLPPGTQWSNGLPFEPTGQLCVSTGPLASYSNGVPFTSVGAVRVALF